MVEFKIRIVPRPWNKGKLVVENPAETQGNLGSASGFKSLAECGKWRCSISVSTASCGPAICSS